MKTIQHPTPDQDLVQQESSVRGNRSSKGKLLIPVLTSIFITALLAGSAVYFWQKEAARKVINDLEQEISSLETEILERSKPESMVQEDTPSVTDTLENWVTYSSSDGVYTFKYPQNFSLSEEDAVRVSFWGTTQRAQTEFYDGVMLTFFSPFQLEGMSLSEYVDQEVEGSEENADILEQKDAIKIGDLEGYTYTARGLGVHQNIYLQSPGKDWAIEIVNSTRDPADQGYDAIAETILSTFEFTQ
jgi:hypothetical protein